MDFPKFSYAFYYSILDKIKNRFRKTISVDAIIYAKKTKSFSIGGIVEKPKTD